MRIWIFCAIFFSSCSLTLEQFYQEQLIPQKSESGFVRNDLFPYYMDVPIEFIGSEFCRYIGLRTNWNPQNNDFTNRYPLFKVELLAVNQLPGNEFSWQERVIFADALDLIVFAINHPLFLTEMRKEHFFDNQGKNKISAETVVAHIRNSLLYFYLGKNSLDKNVLAQATVGGLHNTIWFRNDTDYQNYTLLFLAEILIHEMTHNLGYLHASNVPHGIQSPFIRVVIGASQEEITQFISSTPYYEDILLTRVRQRISSTRADDRIMIINDYVDDLK
ncbi:MAG: hypothetical protein ACRCWI_00235 [Brevinema sp.]